MKHFIMLVVAAACVSGMASAQDREIARKDVPPAILAAFDKAYPAAKVLEWDKEIHGGKLYYEAESVDGKVARNVLYSPDGTLAQIEEKIATNEIPARVVDAVKRLYPNATIGSVEKVMHGNGVEYRLALKGANQKRVAMRADGTVASSEGKTPVDRNE